MKFQLSHIPLRLATGAFILNSGLTKLKVDDEETPKHIHGMAADAYPVLQGVDPRLFTKALGASEVALGAALMAPMVGPAAAGVGLTGFSVGLLGLYWRLPGLRQQDSVRPTQDGIPLAKDIWMLAIGFGLVMDAVSRRARRMLPG